MDLAKWDAALATDQILKQPIREQMWKPAKETTRKLDDKANYFYGFGWQVGQLNGHKLVSHGGTLTGFRSFFLRFLDDKLSVIVLTNEASADPETIARGITAHHLLDLAPAAR